MVEPDGAGVAHRGAQHVAIRRERLKLEPGGIEAGKAPALAGGVERIGRRADAEMAGDRRPARSRHRSRRPARRPRRRDRDRPSCRACVARSAAAPSCRSAVHCTNSTNSISSASAPLRSAAHLASSGCRHSSGHSHHGLLNLCRSTSKQAKRDSSGAALGAEFVEILSARRLRHCALKAANADAQRPPFQAGDGDIIDDIARPQRRERVAWSAASR